MRRPFAGDGPLMRPFTELLARAASVLRSILGVPDYERYVEHCRVHHGDAQTVTRDEFERDVLERKYSRPGTRCC